MNHFHYHNQLRCTQICTVFLENNGYCTRDRCVFAHNREALRGLPQGYYRADTDYPFKGAPLTENFVRMCLFYYFKGWELPEYARDAMAALGVSHLEVERPPRRSISARPKRLSLEREPRRSIWMPKRSRSNAAPIRDCGDIRGDKVESRTDYPNGETKHRPAKMPSMETAATSDNEATEDKKTVEHAAEAIENEQPVEHAAEAIDDQQPVEHAAEAIEDQQPVEQQDDEESIGEVPCFLDDGDGGDHRAGPMKKDTVDFSPSVDDTTISAALSSYGPPTSGDDDAAIQEELPLD